MTKPEIVVDNFAGGGGASTGIEIAIGRSVDIAINHDPAAIAMHRANHPASEHYCENVWDVDPVKACAGRSVALAWFSPDCFDAETMVLTHRSYVRISDVRVGDLVLTHKMRWRAVTDTMFTFRDEMKISGYGNPEIRCSIGHPFYVRSRSKVWNNERRVYDHVYSQPDWRKAKDLTPSDYWGLPGFADALDVPSLPHLNNKCAHLPVDERLMYLAGLYVGDGWTRLTDNRAEVVICCGDKDIAHLASCLNQWERSGSRAQDGELHWNFRKVRTGGQYCANNRSLVLWLRDNFGHLAGNKTIPGWLFGAPLSYREAFLNGYTQTDGCLRDNLMETSTISKSLAYGIKTLVGMMGYSPMLYLNDHPNDVIEGRQVNAQPCYKVKWRVNPVPGHQQTFVEDNIRWCPIYNSVETGEKKFFYNISVEEDESYIAEGVIVHNCKHHSKAKGGKPVDKNIRGLAWVAVRWAYHVRPRVMMLENVEEFQDWGPVNEETGRPIKERAGETFDGFVRALSTGIPRSHPAFGEMCAELKISEDSTMAIALVRGLGYDIEFNLLRACDYGAPTIRKRFFMIARSDHCPIVWPEPTHGEPDSPEVKCGRRKPWVPVADVLDFSLPCSSIFASSEEIMEQYGLRAVRPLSENTMKRIARGVMKFVVNNPKPFIVQVNHKGETFRGQDIDEPLDTITAKHGTGVVMPVMMRNNTNAAGSDVSDPLLTITTGGHIMMIAPSLIQYHSEQNEDVRGQTVDKPVMTVDASNRYGLVSTFITQFNNNSIGQEVTHPLNTMTACTNHFAEVSAFLVKYYGNGDNAVPCTQPAPTITAKDRMGLITVYGQDYQIVDIGMRMLTPRELFDAQGFPEDYIIDVDADGNPYPKSEQVARCGNAVCPPIPTALVRANLPELCEMEAA